MALLRGSLRQNPQGCPDDLAIILYLKYYPRNPYRSLAGKKFQS